MAATLLAATLALPACGKRGNPLPPLRRTPQPVTDLRVSQRGDRLEVAFTAPRTATDGSRLPVLEIELLRAEGDGDFEKVARSTRSKVAPGERIVDEETLPPPGTKLRLAARARARGRPSTLTPVVTLTVTMPPAPPAGLTTRSDPGGAAVSWTAPESPPGPDEGASPAPAFLVYRRPDVRDYGRSLETAPTTETAFIDTTVAAGETWCFVVRAVTSTDPLVESAASNESCLLVQDVAPPATPAGVAAQGREGGIEVSWSPSAEPDLVAHRVYRWSQGVALELIAEIPAPETVYFDVGAPTGVVARYTVTAVDKAGNESERSPGVPASRP